MITPPAQPRLDVAVELSKLQDLYFQEETQNTINVLIYGQMGTGKTHLIGTCPGPVLVHSFDPGGTKTIKDLVGVNNLTVSTFEKDSRKNPIQFTRWQKEFDRLERLGMFQHIRTYVIDSFTSWSDYCLNQIMRNRNSGTNDTPQLPDYMKQQQAIQDAVVICNNLPCNFILTAHVFSDKDEVTGRAITSVLAGKTQRVKLPTKFDEVYVATAKADSKGITFKILTCNDGVYQARTRIGRGGIFKAYEEPNIRALLKKAGYPYEDKVV